MTTHGRNNYSTTRVESLILNLHNERVMLDSDLAAIYGVSTSRFNEAVKRNRHRFPDDFRFQLSAREWNSIRALRSQSAILENHRGRHRKYLPYVFTEHGAIMAANVLNSPRAVQMSVFVVRAFVKMRREFGRSRTLLEKLRQLEKRLAGRIDSHERIIVRILEEIKRLTEPPAVPARRRIGFIREES
jgi:hypothetical protein